MTDLSAELARARDALQFIDPSDRDTWLRTGMAVKDGLNGDGFDVWDEWSQSAASYDPRAARDVWRSIKPGGGVSIATLFHEAKANGWRDNSTYQRPTPEAPAEQRRIAAERAMQEQAERQARQAEAAVTADAIWQAVRPAPDDHVYLRAKGVGAHGLRVRNGELVVPMRHDAKLHSLQFIAGDGDKRFLTGGRVAGCYFSIRRTQGAAATLCIAEGYATGASIHEATGCAVAVAFNAGNLLPVAQALRAKYPDLRLTICADDDAKTKGNPGLTKAREAAQAVGAFLAVPVFGNGRQDKDTDFNDMAQRHGLDAVSAAIERAREPDSETPAHGAGINHDPGCWPADEWPAPQPLTAKANPEPYPVDALPDTIRAAVEEAQGFVKAPVAMVASSALAALSLASQAHADAKRADKLHGPVGLFLLTIADSGERKSTCDGFFTQAIRDYEEAQAEAAKPGLKEHKAAMAAWEAKHNGIKGRITQLAKGSKSTEGMESALRDLEHDKPEPPRVPRLLYADATPEALAFGLARQWPSGGVVSAEAGIVFGSHGMGKDSVMRNLGLLNQLWDGASLTIDRRSTESFTVRGARLTVALQVQEPTLREFFTRTGALARGTGFLARFLVAWPASTQGFRPFTEAPPNWPALAAFNRRIAAILAQPVPIGEDGALTPPMLSLTADAKAAWAAYHDVIECALASGGELYDVRDVASKSADNAVRLAALFQMFEGAGGAIGADAFERASRIAAWHLNESRRFFGELALPAALADAGRLDGWLIEYCRRERVGAVGKNHVRQHGPLRDGERLIAAIRELTELDRVRLVKDGKRVTIQVNPALVSEGGAS